MNLSIRISGVKAIADSKLPTKIYHSSGWPVEEKKMSHHIRKCYNCEGLGDLVTKPHMIKSNAHYTDFSSSFCCRVLKSQVLTAWK